MRSVFKIVIFIFLPFAGSTQIEKKYEDSLHQALNNAASDTIRLDINRKLGFYYQDSEPDTALVYHKAQLALARNLDLKLWQADAYEQIAYCYRQKLQLPLSYENYMLGLQIAEDPSSSKNGWGYSNFSYSKNPEEARWSIVGMIHYEIATLFYRSRYYQKSLTELLQAMEIGESLKNQKILSLATRDIGISYLKNNQPDSAFIYFQKSLSYYQHSPYKKNMGVIYRFLGLYYSQQQKYDSAIRCLHTGIDINQDPASRVPLRDAKYTLGQVFMQVGQLDSALIYTLQAQKIDDSVNNQQGKSDDLIQLGYIYEQKKEYTIAYDYLKKGESLADKLNDGYIDKLMQFQNLDFDQKIRLQQLEKESQLTKSRNRTYALLTGLGIFLLVGLLLYRNNRQKQKANKVLQSTLANLKSTQSQLIQSEKMASLGELTAGIAHEIQNPLNFVNNFSEVNKELTIELEEELNNGKYQDAIAIAKDIRENEEKISHHGKRADAIVKGMLQHSRSSNGIKEPTDINALVDEYLRLAYHGLRAKDKSFNAAMQTDYDHTLEKIKVTPQDMGRVILNLITNAFYVVNEKKKQEPDDYEPTITVKTSRIPASGSGKGAVVIAIKDNGNGIPKTVLDKIFHPFFTTKPTGQGTGLGLSLSYDIVKAHGGDLKVETKEGEGTTFTIELPVV